MLRVLLGSALATVYPAPRNQQQAQVALKPLPPDRVMFGQNVDGQRVDAGALALNSVLALAGQPGTEISVAGILGQTPNGPLKDLLVAYFLFSGDPIKQVGAALELENVSDGQLQSRLRERVNALGDTLKRDVASVKRAEATIKTRFKMAGQDFNKQVAVFKAHLRSTDSEASVYAIARIFAAQSDSQFTPRVPEEVMRDAIRRFARQDGANAATPAALQLLLGTLSTESFDLIEPYMSVGSASTQNTQLQALLDDIRTGGSARVTNYRQFLAQTSHRTGIDDVGTLMLLNMRQVLPETELEDGALAYENAVRIAQGGLMPSAPDRLGHDDARMTPQAATGYLATHRAAIILAGSLIGPGVLEAVCRIGELPNVLEAVIKAQKDDELLRRVAIACNEASSFEKVAALFYTVEHSIPQNFYLGALRPAIVI